MEPTRRQFAFLSVSALALAGCNSNSKSASQTAVTAPPLALADQLAAKIAAAEFPNQLLARPDDDQQFAIDIVARTIAAPGDPTLAWERASDMARAVGRPELASLLYGVSIGQGGSLALLDSEVRAQVLYEACYHGFVDPARGEFRRFLAAKLPTELGFGQQPFEAMFARDTILERMFRGSIIPQADVKQAIAAAQDDQPAALFDLVGLAMQETSTAMSDGLNVRKPEALVAAACRLRGLVAIGDHLEATANPSAQGFLGSLWKGVKSVGGFVLKNATSLMSGGLPSVIQNARNIVGTVSNVVKGVKGLFGGNNGGSRFVLPWPNGEVTTQRMVRSLQHMVRAYHNEILARLDRQEARLIEISRQLAGLFDLMNRRFDEIVVLLNDLRRDLAERLRELALKLDQLETAVRTHVTEELAELAVEIDARFTQVIFQQMADAQVRIQSLLSRARADENPISRRSTIAELSTLVVGSAESVLLFQYAPSASEDDLGRHTPTMAPFRSTVAWPIQASVTDIVRTILATLGARTQPLANPVALTLPALELAQVLAAHSSDFPGRTERAAVVRELLVALRATVTNVGSQLSSGLQLTASRFEDLLVPAAAEWIELVQPPFAPKVSQADRPRFARWIDDEAMSAATGRARIALGAAEPAFVSGTGPITYYISGGPANVVRGRDALKALVQFGLLRAEATTTPGVFTLTWDVGNLASFQQGYSGRYATVELVTAGTELIVRLSVDNRTAAQANLVLADAALAVTRYERDLGDIVRNRIANAELRGLRALFSMQAATRFLLETARDTFVADPRLRIRLTALLERPFVLGETLGTARVDPRAALSWRAHVRQLASTQVTRLLGRELSLPYLDSLVDALRIPVQELHTDAVTVARAIESALSLPQFGVAALEAWVGAGAAQEGGSADLGARKRIAARD